MKLVIIESPFAGFESWNSIYARAALRDSLGRGEAPLASHLLYTQPGVLDDSVPEERARGISAGHAWMPFADAVAVYDDLGISDGMKAGIREAKALRVPIEYRQIEGWPT